MSPNPYWPVNFYWTTVEPVVLNQVGGLRNARILLEIGDEVPALTCAAVAHAARHNVGETILAAWLVCESILTSEWRKHLATIRDSGRRKRLEDFRIYSASVQLETLFTAGKLTEPVYSALHAARKIRNDLAHSAKMTQQGASVALDAMRSALGLVGVSGPQIGYVFQGGGIGAPVDEFDPEFPFR
jgi:hypothetical protein